MKNRQQIVKRHLGALPLILARLESIWAVVKDKKWGWAYIVGLVLMAIYVIWPLDAVPDPLVVIGWLDDLLAATIALTLLVVRAQNFYGAIRARKEAEAEIEDNAPRLGEVPDIPDLDPKGEDKEVPAVAKDLASGNGSSALVP